MIPGSANPLLLKSAAAAGAYQVSRSLRFNSSDSAYLSRTPGTAGNRQTWTWAGWVKRSAVSSGNQRFFGIFQGGVVQEFFVFSSGDTLRIAVIQETKGFTTTQVFRDPSAWYHIVVVLDTPQATASDRLKLYVNGTQVTTFSSTDYPVQNSTGDINNTYPHFISNGGGGEYFNGYMADIHFIDGQALTPSSFTEVSATTGQLIPLAYSGSFGTNGFWLKFSDNSAATAATLGKDYSGNSNNWTPNNLSVTAGAGNDSLLDTPTSYGTPDTGVGGEVRGNYCTWSPLDNVTGSDLANGNLDMNVTSNAAHRIGTMGVSSGKWYYEFVQTTISGSGPQPGINSQRETSTYNTRLMYYVDGYKYSGASGSAYGATWTINDIIGIALDLDSGTLTFYKNGVSQGIAFTGLSGTYYPWIRVDGVGSVCIGNWGQRPWAYAAPSGFRAWCDTSIPEGTITTSGTFTGNASADGPFVYLNGVPTAMTINSNAVTFATHADKLSNGFKLRTSSGSYNTAGSNSYSITTTGAKFKYARAQPNP